MNEQFYIHAPWKVCPRITFTVTDFGCPIRTRVCIFVNVHLKVGCILRKTLACKTSINLNNLVIQSLKHTYMYILFVRHFHSRSSAV